MNMAHDPTRSWPTGKGPDNTSIPGAAWLELLDGQAFPVVGAGVMVRDGNLWTPASSSNPLHTRDAALASLIGALNAAKETNPDAASASMLALLRGMLATFGKETTLAAVKAAAESLAQEDFATETTLAALLSAVGNLATEATLSGVKSAVDTLAGTVADGAQKVQLQGQTAVLTTLVSAQAITDTVIRSVTFDASPYRQIDFIVRNSLDSEVAIGFRMPDFAGLYIIDDDGAVRAYTPDPAHPSYRWHRVPAGATSGVSRYFMLSQIPLNDGKFKAPFRDYLFTADIRYRAVNTPTEGSLSIILVGVPN